MSIDTKFAAIGLGAIGNGTCITYWDACPKNKNFGTKPSYVWHKIMQGNHPKIEYSMGELPKPKGVGLQGQTAKAVRPELVPWPRPEGTR